MTTPTEFHLDVLREMVNTGVGRAAASLNQMLESHIELDVPSIAMVNPQTLLEGPNGLGPSALSCVKLGFHGSFQGTAALVFPPQSAAKLVAALTGEDIDGPSLNAVMAGTLNEVGNILINGVIGTMANLLARPFDYSLPNYLEGHLRELLGLEENWQDVRILVVRTRFQVRERQIEGNIFIIFDLVSFDALLNAIDKFDTDG